MDPTTLATIPRLIAQVLAIHEADAEAVFARAGLSLPEVIADDARVPMAQMAALWQQAVAATGNPQLGLTAASLFQPAYLKGLGLAWMASANLEEGLRRFVSHGQLVNTLMNIELETADDELLIRYRSPVPLPADIKGHPCAIQLGVGFFLKMFRLAAAKSIPARRVHFKFSIDEALPVYEEFFQCPVRGDSEFNGIAFSRTLLTEMLPTHDPELVQMNEQAVEKYLGNMDRGRIAARVVQQITEQLPSGCPSEEQIAFRLHMSKRTLQRKLSAEGQSFSSLLASIRLALAKQHLAAGRHSVTEIAYQLGYSSPSTFARAFRQLAGQTPGEFRNANG